jgi:tetratricopeptide (TPR) repeat protein
VAAQEPVPADAPLASGTTGPTPADATPAEDADAAFRREFAARRYDAAIPHAQRALEQAQQQAATPTAEAVQVAWLNLATTQYLAGDLTAAEASFQRAIDLIESAGRPLDARLARAYAGLATSYHAAQRYDLAVRSFDRAIALSRRHEGLLNERQVALLDKYIDSLTQLGRYEDALRAQRYQLRIATRKYGDDSVELVPTLEKLGRWYTSVGAYDAARRVLQRGIDLAEKAEGVDSPRLVGPLLALAACNRRQLLDPALQAGGPDPQRAAMFNDPAAGMMPSGTSPVALAAEGERALQRAAAIAEKRSDMSPLQVAEVRVQLGDWYQLRGQTERALPHYRMAWQAASRVEGRVEGRSLVDLLFGKPLLLHISRPEGWNRHAAQPPDRTEVRNVTARLEVDAAGRAQSAQVVDDSGDAKRGERTLAALASARYRPRFEQGEPVSTPAVEFSQPWILLLDDKQAQADAAPAPR